MTVIKGTSYLSCTINSLLLLMGRVGTKCLVPVSVLFEANSL